MTSRPEAVFVSYRLGGSDGVAVEARKWEWALQELGFRTRRVAGELERLRPDDTWLPFLAIEPVDGARPEADALSAAIAGADLVVVENIASLPLNVDAATTTREVLARHSGRVCFHHHDFTWERPHLATLEGFPPTREHALHVTITDHARRDLLQRGFTDVVCIPNSFDFDAPAGDRIAERERLGVGDDDRLLLQPTRAIPRKNVAGGLAFATALDRLLTHGRVRYWLTGPAEDGFNGELARVLAQSEIPIIVGRSPRPSDAYAAADLVVFPSTWEGFGNPVIESVIARRMVTVGTYPVLDEIADGLTLLSTDRPDDARAWLATPSLDVLERNWRHARTRFGLEQLPGRIRSAFAQVGWEDW